MARFRENIFFGIKMATLERIKFSNDFEIKIDTLLLKNKLLDGKNNDWMCIEDPDSTGCLKNIKGLAAWFRSSFAKREIIDDVSLPVLGSPFFLALFPGIFVSGPFLNFLLPPHLFDDEEGARFLNSAVELSNFASVDFLLFSYFSFNCFPLWVPEGSRTSCEYGPRDEWRKHFKMSLPWRRGASSSLLVGSCIIVTLT